jgi:hypothetical protein
MTPEEEIRRAEKARTIVNDDIYQEAMAKLKKNTIDLWAACSALDVEKREWLWQQYQAVLRFEQEIQEVMNSGKLAQEAKKRGLMERALHAVGAK